MCIQTGKTLEDDGRMRMTTQELYVKSEEEMLSLFPDQQAAIAREENPEASLTELSGMMEPPISKPAMNHRLKKIVQFSQEGTL